MARKKTALAFKRFVMGTTEFKDWRAGRRALERRTGIPKPKQGDFHAFMTDIGKFAKKKMRKAWRLNVRRADEKGTDAPGKRAQLKRRARRKKK